MDDKERFRKVVKENLDEAVRQLNSLLKGEGLVNVESTIQRLGRGGQLPHWYEGLRDKGALPNLDGKSIGSVVEMLFVAVLETGILRSNGNPILRINPARGVDLPDLDLGVKSPSTNYCTSEPFFSAYERLYGSDYDSVVLLTDYQTAKRKAPLQLQIIDSRYLAASEIADANLCKVAKKHRDWLLSMGEGVAQRVFRFLAYVNQSDWRANQLLSLLSNVDQGDLWVVAELKKIEKNFAKQNKNKQKKDKPLIPEADLASLQNILTVAPHSAQLLNELDNWVMEFLKDAARAPNDNEWRRIKSSPLNGKISMSFALQWRYAFGGVFGNLKEEPDAFAFDICD